MSRLTRCLVSIGVLFYAAFSWAGIEAIYGDWEGGGGAASAIFGTMTITKFHLTWKGKAPREPRCTVRYTHIPESFGVKFRDGAGHEFVSAPDSPFQTFLLKVEDRKRCALRITHFRLTLREDLPVSVLDEIHFYDIDDARGYGSFSRPVNE